MKSNFIRFNITLRNNSLLCTSYSLRLIKLIWKSVKDLLTFKSKNWKESQESKSNVRAKPERSVCESEMIKERNADKTGEPSSPSVEESGKPMSQKRKREFTTSLG